MANKIYSEKEAQVIGIIPARFASTRFPGKMLAPIAGKSLIQRTYENASKCSFLNRLIVATDDHRIYNHVREFGGDAVMTSVECPTGTDRLVDAIRNEAYLNEYPIVINIQGDEPCVDPDVIQKISETLINDPEAVVATAVSPIKTLEEAASRSIVKCVFDKNCRALYFSRSLIPSKSDAVHYRHIGIYGYRREFLLTYANLPQTPLQQAEDLEQLKILEHGFRIAVAIVDEVSVGVDMPEDISRVEEWLCKQNISLSQAAFVRR